MRQKTLLLLLTLCLVLAGCGFNDEAPDSEAMAQQSRASFEPEREDLTPHGAPSIATAVFHPELAEGNAEALIDLSAVSEGYVAVSASSEHRLKFQVLKDDFTYNYDISSDRKPSVFPLQCGDGHYTFRIMENIVDNKYAQLYTAECDVTLQDEFQPFLRPSDYAPYDADSLCVKTAADIASECGSTLEFVGAVYGFVCGSVAYDSEKAASVQSGYMPDPDETLSSGKGICFDYAALAAAMLRSQGIPAKIIFGYVAPNNLYHAWNMFYTAERGWVTVSFEVNDRSWNRIDLTFSAGGASDEFIGDGSHYTDVFSY